LAIVLIYPYIFYPVILLGLQRFRSIQYDFRDGERLPSIAIVISVYNGEEYIKNKIDNLLEQTGFDKDCFIYIVSDGSTDKTEEVVESVMNDQIFLIKTGGRVGKTQAENMALERIDSDVVLFTDVSTIFDKNVLYNLRKCMTDTRVGCVSTVDKVRGDNESLADQEGLYVRYEMLLRKLESNLGILVGASGSGYVCKRQLAKPIPENMTRDMYTPLLAREHGLLSFSDEQSICIVKTQQNPAKEYARKVRTIVGGYDTLWYMKRLMNPFKYGLFAFALISHKLLRWFGWLFIIGIIFTTAVLMFGEHSKLYQLLFAFEITFVLLSIAKYYGLIEIKMRYFDALYYFMLANVASLHALYKSITGKSAVIWEPTKR